MRKTFSFLAIVTAWALVSPAHALTPPLSPEVLQKEADLIVEGEVLGPIYCEARIEQTSCADVYRYYVPLEIKKILKGDANVGEILRLNFVHYDYSKSQCVGDQGPTVQDKQRGAYYLKKIGPGNYNLWHWSAVKVKTAGKGDLPKCP